MMLSALVDYYRQLEQDPDSDIAPFGFSKQMVSFCVVIDANGQLDQIQPLDREEGKRRVAQLITVPGGAKPPGSGINPCFLWDNTAYMLGYQPDEAKAARAPECFEKFRGFHLSAENEINDPEFSAVCRFLESWSPERAADYPELTKLIPGFGVFKLRGETHFVHDRQQVQAWWRGRLSAGEDEASLTGQCLITGEVGPLAKLHEPAIKGISGAQSSGAKIVSFNADAFESYGKSQSYNAPVSERAAFEYCTALNSLLEPNSRRRVRLADTTVTFWTDQPTLFEDDFGYVSSRAAAEDADTARAIEARLARIRDGKYVAEYGAPETPFYLLGLSPNVSRLSVRMWLRSTLGELLAHLGEHFRDLALVRGPNDLEFPAAYQLLRETAREAKDIPPLLEGSLMRAIWEGLPYPEALYAAVLRRIKADQRVSYLRVAILKATLQRKARLKVGHDFLAKEMSVALDPDRPEPAYHLGRLFSVFEKAQEEALGRDLNRTIRESFYGAASAAPGSVFPRLVRLHPHHIAKLQPRRKTFFNALGDSIFERISNFPTYLTLSQQGLFAIGYHHQRQDFFKSKNHDSPASED